MANTRLEDLAAAQEQLKVMDELQHAKEEKGRLEEALSNPKGLDDLEEPDYKKNQLQRDYDEKVASIEQEIKSLEWSKFEFNPVLYGFLLIISVAIAIVVLCVFNFWWAVLAFIAVFSVVSIILSSIENKKNYGILEEIERCKRRIEEKKETLQKEIQEAAAEDRATKEAYEKRCNEIMEAAKAELMSSILTTTIKIKALEEKYQEVAVIPSFTYSDREELGEIILALRENYASSIPEARRYIDEKKAIKDPPPMPYGGMGGTFNSNLPGTVVVYAIEDNKGQNADVYVDGNYYCAITSFLGFTSFQLSPGVHNISVVINSHGYHFRSGVESINLMPGKEVNVKFTVLGYNLVSGFSY